MEAVEMFVAGVGALAIGLIGLNSVLRFRYRRQRQRAQHLRARYAVAMAKRDESVVLATERFARRA